MSVAEARVALLFADISGSTALYEERGDGPALAIISICRCCMAQAISEAGGQLVKNLGDGVMAVFDDAGAALRAAREMQEALTTMPGQPGLRVGVHFGPVLAENGDYFGDTVNVAARLMDLARSGEVLTSLQTALALPPPLRNQLESVGLHQLKGRAETIDVYQLRHQATPCQPVQMTRTVTQDRLELTWSDTGRLTLGEELPVASLGSGSADEVCLGGEVQPGHGRIEWQGDSYVLVDCSDVGIHLVYPGQPPLFLRHEEAPLRGAGEIRLGSETLSCIRFRYL